MSASHPEMAAQVAALPVLVRAARAAAQAAMPYFHAGAATSAKISYKTENSPVTEADFAADAAIRAVFAADMPDAIIFSEEDDETPARHDSARVIVVDPIDGTRAFIQGRDEWCVSIALMVDSRPVAGVIHAPVRGEMFAAALGHGATLNGTSLPRRGATGSPLRISGPNRLVDTMTEHWPPTVDGETLRALAYRLVSVAAGQHDIALATPGAHDWDLAAAEVILAETGCQLRSLTGGKPVYNAINPVHPALIAAEAVTAGRLLAALAEAGIKA